MIGLPVVLNTEVYLSIEAVSLQEENIGYIKSFLSHMICVKPLVVIVPGSAVRPTPDIVDILQTSNPKWSNSG